MLHPYSHKGTHKGLLEATFVGCAHLWRGNGTQHVFQRRKPVPRNLAIWVVELFLSKFRHEMRNIEQKSDT